MTKVHENKPRRGVASYGGFFSSSKQSWRQPQKVPPSHPGASGGSASYSEASSPLPPGPLGDETVRWAKSDSTPITSLPISKSSSSWETGLAGRERIPSSSTSMSCVWPSAGGESEAGVVVLSEGASLTPGAGATSACAL